MRRGRLVLGPNLSTVIARHSRSKNGVLRTPMSRRSRLGSHCAHLIGMAGGCGGRGNHDIVAGDQSCRTRRESNRCCARRGVCSSDSDQPHGAGHTCGCVYDNQPKVHFDASLVVARTAKNYAPVIAKGCNIWPLPEHRPCAHHTGPALLEPSLGNEEKRYWAGN